MASVENLKKQISMLNKLGLDASHLQEQLDKLQPNEQPIALDNAQDVGWEESAHFRPLTEPSENEQTVDIREPTPPIKAAPSIQDTEAQGKELDEDIEPSETQKIVVAPADVGLSPTITTIESYQSAWTLACCYLWLTSKNINERKGVMFDIPRPFRELANKNFLLEVPEKAEWTTWNRIYGCAIERFQISQENIKQYKQSLKEVMCLTPHWWREKYLANSELSTK